MAGCKAPVRQFLESVEETRLRVGRLRRSVNMLQSRCRCGASEQSSPIDPQKEHSDLPDTLREQKKQLSREERQLRKLEEKVERWIELLPRPRWRMVLRYHYLDGMLLSDVAKEMSKDTGREFTPSQVYHYHHVALKAAEDLWPLDLL